MYRREFFKGIFGFITIIFMPKSSIANNDISKEAEKLSKRLQKPTGYFDWTPLNKERTLWMRTPAPERNLKEEWLKEEPVKVIHICNLMGLVQNIKIVEKKKKKEARKLWRSFDYCGYIHEGKCVRCNTVIS